MPDDLDYACAFEAFLATTNEKEVLCQELTKIINDHQVKSLLDIGPGNGDLSIPLSRLVEHYIGVEPIFEYAQKLQVAGLHIINQPFPTELLEHFDMVLACHVISVDETNIPEFLNAAWERLVAGGILAIVTHSGAERDWNTLSSMLGRDDLPYHRAVFERVRQLLEERGKTELRTLVTTVESTSVDQMISALGFVWSDGTPSKLAEFESKSTEIARLLNSRYRTNDHYSFPFEHSILVATKP